MCAVPPPLQPFLLARDGAGVSFGVAVGSAKANMPRLTNWIGTHVGARVFVSMCVGTQPEHVSTVLI